MMLCVKERGIRILSKRKNIYRISVLSLYCNNVSYGARAVPHHGWIL